MIRPLLLIFIGAICFVTVSGEYGKFDRQVFYKPSLIAIIDKSAKMGMILDYSSRLILAINGRHSSLIVVDISEQVRYFLKNDDDTENKIWSNFKEYFDELSSLKPLLKSGKEKGEKSKLSNLKDPSVNKLLDEIFNSLGGSSLVTKERSLLIKFMEQLRGPLSLIYRGNGCFRIFIEVIEFTKVNLAVAELLNYSKEKLSPEDVHLDATAIFKAQSGAEVLLKVMCQIGIHFDLTKLFDGLLSSPEKVQSLLINASSGSHDGLDGLIRILANYVGVFTGKSSIIRLSSSILGFRSRPGPSLSGFVEQILTEVKNQDKRFHNAPRFSMYVSILEGMITYDYTDHNISLSDIITRLPTKTGRSSNRLLTLVEQLSSLYPASTIPHFFGSIMKKFNWTVASESTPEKSNAQVFFTHPFIAFINEPVRMAVIIDYSSRLMVLFNGKQSSMIVMDISEQVLYHLENEADTENSFWSNFRGYIQKLSSLQSFLKTGQEKGKKFELKTLAGPVLGELVEVSKSLGASLPIAEELSLHTKLIEQLRGVLAFVFRGDGGFRIDSGGDVFIKVSLAMAAMLTGSKE